MSYQSDSASSEPARKRPRRDSSTPSATPPPRLPSSYTAFTRDEVFWYPDGNIILVAQGVGFRLYQGLLAQHSAVFQDMFNLPAPAPGSDASQEVDTDGCPVVHITDTASELRSLLSFLIRARR